MLHERTEGWVIGLQIVGSALRGRTRDQTSNSSRSSWAASSWVTSYLWEEVLERQPDDVRSFLLHTSVLDRFNASLCDAVTEQRNGDEMLRRCERDNLFILPLVGQGAWYRFHHLFADALREHLGRTVSEDEIIGSPPTRRAWLEANGYFEDAIRHATAGRQWDHVVGCSRWSAPSFSSAIRLRPCAPGCRGSRPTSSPTSPRLAFWLAWAQGRTGRWAKASASLRSAEETWAANGDRLGEGLVLLWHAARCLWELNSRRPVDYAQRALDTLPADRPTERILALMT